MTTQPSPVARIGSEGKLLAGASLILAFSAVGFLVQTFGVFSAAIEQEFGWSRTETYSVLTIATLLAPVLIPLTGWAADRLNLRTLVISALVVEVVSLLALGLVPVGRIGFSILFLVTYAASFGASAVPLAKAVGAAFSKRRGAALGMLFAGACLGAIANPLVAGALIGAVGWRGAFAVLGAQTAVLAALPALLLIRSARGAPRTADADRPAGWSTLFRTRALSAILGWGFFAALGYSGMQGHLVPLLQERAHTAAEAVIGQSLLGVGLLVGNLAAGLLLDRLPTRPLASLMLVVPVVALLALALLPPGPWDVVVTTGLGVATGTETAMLAYVVSRYLPTAVAGRALSIGMVAVALGGGVSTLIGAATHDATGNYRLFLLLCAASLTVASVWPWALREPSSDVSSTASSHARDATS
ncbi:MFS transporter [Microbacterium azadirachtae]|uniref:MFS transporter n=1 Tax=Microbacterium azadirachtae TaxID=582680 RepID=UPI0021D4D010|nr:MFS transporter [Microbacterium azadirachtae]UXW85073.1 MFS transporter [Microbacterium azadirachtae]